MRKKFKTLIISSVILGSLYGIYYFGIPAIVNLSKHKIKIQQLVFKKTGFNINYTDAHFKTGLLPSIIIDAKNFEIISDKNISPLKINNPHIKIKILPLLFKKLAISDFSADELNSYLIIDKNFNLKLGEYNVPLDLLAPFTISEAKISISKFNIQLSDNISQKSINIIENAPLAINYASNKFANINAYAKLQSATPAKLYIDAKIKWPLNKIDKENFFVKSSIENLNLSDFSSFATAFSRGEITKLAGIINYEADTQDNIDGKQIISTLTLNNFNIYNKDPFKSISSKNKLVVNSNISPNNNTLEINNLKLTGQDINIDIYGKINKINSKKPYYDINTTINQSRVESFIPLLPGEENLSPDINLYKLKQHPFYGDIIGNLSITGNNLTPNIIGDILVSNGYLIKPIQNTSGAKIKLEFDKDVLNLDVHVPTDRNQYVNVKGPIQLYGSKDADLQITSSNNVNLATAQFVLNPLHQILNFVIGPVPIMDIKGQGGINLRVYGNKKNPHAFGNLQFKNGIVSFNDIKNMTIKNAAGELIFNDINTKFTTISATLNNKPIAVNGTCDLYGNLDFNVEAHNQNLNDFVKILSKSPMLGNYSKLVQQIEFANGSSDLYLNLTGQVPDPNNIIVGQNIFAKGIVSLNGNILKTTISPVQLKNIKGKINFDNEKASFNLNSYINNALIKISGVLDKTNLSTKFTSDRFSGADLISLLPSKSNIPYSNDFKELKTSFAGSYNGNIENIDYNKIILKGKVYDLKGNDFSTANSTFELNNGDFKLSNLYGKIKQNPYNISLNIKNAFDKKRSINGQINLNEFEIATIEDFIQLIPKNSHTILSDIKNLNGKINLSSKITNNKIRAFGELDGVEFEYLPQKVKLSILSGNLFLNNNQLNINKLNTKFGGMPIFLNGKITNLFKTPNIDIYLNTQPSQDFVDRFYNNTQVYPIKIKGDISLTSRLKGNKHLLSTNSTLNINENSSIYYMGASLGDSEYPVKITTDSEFNSEGFILNNFKYNKIITSQNNKPYETTQLEASGKVNYLKNNILAFKDFKIRTLAPTDAKIFNIIFRKPVMKQGIFTSDLQLNGTSLNPKIIGKFDMTSIDIPFYNSTIKDINLDFQPDKIFIKSNGSILSSTVNIDAVAKNRFLSPFVIENMDLNFDTLDIDIITDMLRDFEISTVQTSSNFGEIQNENFDYTQLIVNNAKVKADKINVKNIDATNFESEYSLNEKMLLNVKDYKFDVAQGKVSGNAYYNLLNHAVGLKMHMIDANAQEMSEALFDLKGQIYGLITGDVNLMCNAKTHEKCLQTLSGDAFFIVKDGKMPKLGSLEYLLKAGNLISGGITGLSINGIIDLITPLKTGDFASISGDIHIENGIAQKINIYSDGNDLNMYMTGSYNISNAIADMKIFGSLSKNMTNVFSKIKNVSLNTLLNTIPWIGGSEDVASYQNEIAKIPTTKNKNNIHKIFVVDINGDINGSDYVKSFKWVK